MKLGWFQKAKKIAEAKADHTDFDDDNNPSASQQGNWTDHVPSPYLLRAQMDPMGKDETEAFQYVMNMMREAHPDDDRQSTLIEWGEDEGWLLVDKDGMLRVSKEPPK